MSNSRIEEIQKQLKKEKDNLGKLEDSVKKSKFFIESLEEKIKDIEKCDLQKVFSELKAKLQIEIENLALKYEVKNLIFEGRVCLSCKELKDFHMVELCIDSH